MYMSICDGNIPRPFYRSKKKNASRGGRNPVLGQHISGEIEFFRIIATICFGYFISTIRTGKFIYIFFILSVFFFRSACVLNGFLNFC